MRPRTRPESGPEGKRTGHNAIPVEPQHEAIVGKLAPALLAKRKREGRLARARPAAECERPGGAGHCTCMECHPPQSLQDYRLKQPRKGIDDGRPFSVRLRPDLNLA